MLKTSHDARVLNEAQFLTARESAAYLNCSHRWLVAQAIPVVRVGRLVRYRKRDLDAFMEANLDTASSETD